MLARLALLASLASGCGTLTALPAQDSGPPDGPEDAGAPDASMADAAVADGGSDAGADAGLCGQGPCPTELVAGELDLPDRMGQGGNFLYWLELGKSARENEGELSRLPKGAVCPKSDGGCVTDLNPQPGYRLQLQSLAVTADRLCWLESNVQARLIFCQRFGRAEQLLVADALPYAFGLAQFEGQLLWLHASSPVNANNGLVLRKASTEPRATAPTVLAGNRTNPSGVTADAQAVYFTEGGRGVGGGAVLALPPDGGLPVPLATGLNAPAEPKAWRGMVYWVEGEAGLVRRVPTDGGSVETLALRQKGPFRLAVGDKGVFWLNLGTGPDYLDGELMRWTPEEGLRTLATAQRNVGDLVLEPDGAAAAFVTWSTWGTGSLGYPDGAVRRQRVP